MIMNVIIINKILKITKVLSPYKDFSVSPIRIKGAQ